MRISLTLLTLLTLSIFLVSHAKAQPAVRDSLLKLVPAANEDTNAVLLFDRIGMAAQDLDVTQARMFFNKAIALSRKIQDTIFVVRSMTLLSGTYAVTDQADSMLYYNLQALPLAHATKDSLIIGQILFNIGIAYRDMSDYENAIKYCLEGKALMERKANTRNLAEIDDALCILYHYQGTFTRAIEFGDRAVQQARILKYPGFLAQCLINVSLACLQTPDLEKGRRGLEEARQIGIALKDQRIEAYAIMNLAEYHAKKEEYPQVRKLSEQGLVMLHAMGAEEGEATELKAIAICYLWEKNYKQARAYIDKALAIDRKISSIREEASALLVLASIQYATGDIVNALRTSNLSDSIQSKMVEKMLSDKSANLEKKYETEKKETRIKELEDEKKIHQLTIRQKNTLVYILIGSAVFLAVLVLMFQRNHRQQQRLQQQRINKLETEKRLTATEAVLKGEEQERSRLAQELHDGLGGMLSGIKYSFKTMQGHLIMTPENVQAFERSMDMLDSSIKEMRRVAHNMMPEALVKFGLDAAIRDFCNDITKSGALKVSYVSMGMENMIIDQTMAITIYRIIQELLNNSMKHAGAQTAIVQVMRSNGQLAVTVEDNGRGFDTSILQSSGGIGWSNIRNRVEFLKGQLSIRSDTGKGTSVHIELPV